jgi:hypothetical protein
VRGNGFSKQTIQQPLGFLLDGEDVGADLLQRAQRLRLVEVPREADLVADLGGVFLDPGVGRVGQHLAADEGLDAAFFEQRHLLGVAQVGVGLVFDDAGLPSTVASNRPRSGSALALPGLWTLAMTGGAVSSRQLTALRSASGRRRELDAGLLERGVHAVAEEVVVLEQRIAQRRAQLGGDLDQAAVALPGLGVEQLLALLLGQALLGAAALFVVALVVVAPQSARRFSSAAETLAKR